MNPAPLSTPLRRTAAAAVLALAGSSLAACGASSNDASGPSGDSSTTADNSAVDSSAAPAPTNPPSSATTSSTGPMSAADFVKVYSAALDKATTAKVTFALTGATPGKGSGVQDFTTTPTASDLTLSVSGQTSRFILVDGASYIGAPDGTYLKVDLTKALGGSTSLFDPKATLAVLQKAIVKATDGGEQSVGGQSLHEYTVTLDPSVFLKEFSGTSTSLPKGSLPSSITEDLYLDSEGRPAKAVVDEGGKIGTATVTYSDWGVKADIVAPPKSKVQSLPSSVPTN